MNSQLPNPTKSQSYETSKSQSFALGQDIAGNPGVMQPLPVPSLGKDAEDAKIKTMDSKTKAFIADTRLQISALRKALDGLEGALSGFEAKTNEAQPRRRQNLRQVRIVDAAHHFNKYAGRVKE